MKPPSTPGEIRLRQPQLHGEAAGDAENQQHDERFDVPELILLHVEHEQHVERRQADTPHQRQAEQQIERDGRADHLGQIAGRNRNLTQQPQHDRRRTRIVIAAGLGEIAPAGDPEPQRERLQQDRHQVRQHDHAQQRVAVPRTARQIGRPVAGIHVPDRDQVARARKRSIFRQKPPVSGIGTDPCTSGRLTVVDGLTPAVGCTRPPPLPVLASDISPIRYTTRNPLLKRKALECQQIGAFADSGAELHRAHGAWGLPLVAGTYDPVASDPSHCRSSLRHSCSSTVPTLAQTTAAPDPVPAAGARCRTQIDLNLINLPTTMSIARHKGYFRLTHRFARDLRRGSFGGTRVRSVHASTRARSSASSTGSPSPAICRPGVHRSLLSKTIQTFAPLGRAPAGGLAPGFAVAHGSYEGLNNLRENHQPGVAVTVSRTFGDRLALYATPAFVADTHAVDFIAGHDDHDHDIGLEEDEHANHNDTWFAGIGGRLRFSHTRLYHRRVHAPAARLRPEPR